MSAPTAAAPAAAERALSAADELRAQYVACSYLADACQEALGRFPAPVSGSEQELVAQRALEFILAIEWDWRQTLQELARRVATAPAGEGGYNPTYAEDASPTRQSVARYRGNHHRRPSVRRRV